MKANSRSECGAGAGDRTQLSVGVPQVSPSTRPHKSSIVLWSSELRRFPFEVVALRVSGFCGSMPSHGLRRAPNSLRDVRVGRVRFCLSILTISLCSDHHRVYDLPLTLLHALCVSSSVSRLRVSSPLPQLPDHHHPRPNWCPHFGTFRPEVPAGKASNSRLPS